MDSQRRRFIVTVDLDETGQALLEANIPSMCVYFQSNVSVLLLDELEKLPKEEMVKSMRKVAAELPDCPHCKNGTPHPEDAEDAVLHVDLNRHTLQ